MQLPVCVECREETLEIEDPQFPSSADDGIQTQNQMTRPSKRAPIRHADKKQRLLSFDVANPTPLISSSCPSCKISFTDNSEAMMRNDPENNTIESFPLKKRRLTSSVWNDFEKVREESGKEFATCKHCKRKLVGDSKKGTSHLHKHLKKCLLYNRVHPEVSQLMLKTREEKRDGISRLTTKADKSHEDGNSPLMAKPSEPTGDGAGNIEHRMFDQERSRNDLARMIILHEYPFSIIDHYGFRVFVNNLQPSFKIMSHSIIKADCMRIFDMEKEKLSKALDKLTCRISLTIDMRMPYQHLQHLSLTAHYIDDDWKLQKKLLNYCLVEEPCTAESISKAVLEKLYSWNICGKLSSITLDNSSINDMVVHNLVSKLESEGLLLKYGDLFHVHCCTHILNLIVQDGLEVIHDITRKVRDVVKFVNSSEVRKQKFHDAARQVQALQKNLILDDPARWKSTYMMLETAIEFKDAICVFLSEYGIGCKVLLSSEEWEKAIVTCECLKLFYDVARIFSETKYPTVSRCFSEICGITLQLKEWCAYENHFIVPMAMKMKKTFDKYWSDTSLILAIAAILDPRVKMKSIEYYFPLVYGNETESRKKAIQKGLQNLYNEYAACSTSAMPDREFSLNVESSISNAGRSSGFIGTPSHGTFSDRRKGLDKFLQQSSSSKQVKTDLEMYLEDSVHPLKNDLDLDLFDVLGWWKFNAPKYPILAQMAHDILAISVSTFSSEAAVELGGRFLDRYGPSIPVETVQGLICVRDWLRKEIEASGLPLGDSSMSPLSSVTDGDDFEDTEIAPIMTVEDNKTS